MAVDAALHSAKKPAGLIIQAGAIDGTLAEWTPLLKSMKGLRYLQFHHVKDIDIPIDFGRELDEFLSIGGLKGELIEARKPYFDNHAIDPEVTSQPIAEFVDSLRAWTRRP